VTRPGHEVRRRQAVHLVRGIRLLIPASVATICVVGVVLRERGFVALGAIILAEELYETGVLVAVLRLSERGAARTPEADGGRS
jgi:hypothetical protein